VPRRNIGVAIGIPEPYGPELQLWRKRLGDPQADAIPPHVTLLPPTALAEDHLPVVREHLLAVAADEAPFDIHLRGSATFRPVSPVVFVVLALGISHCERLERRVRSGPLDRQIKFPYHPHVTVAHDLDDEALDTADASLASYEAWFRVDGFTMFEQGDDSVWRPLEDFPFGAAG
jgi:2'-5' RNA ligase